ncbi:MAG: hypothetical protein WBP48_12220, partial [Microbacterium sp.]
MDLLTAPLGDLLTQAAGVVDAAVSERAFQRASEHELAGQVTVIAAVGRLVEALLVDAVGEVMARSETGFRDEFMTSHLGCRNVTELVERLT